MPSMDDNAADHALRYEIARETLRQAVGVGLAQAERGEFSSRSVTEIAASVLAEDDDQDICRLDKD